MKSQKKRWKITLTASLLIVLLLTSLSYAAGNKKTKKMLEAWYGSINIIYNGQNVTTQFEPFVANNTSYVPLRTISTVFNKDVEWNTSTNTATITDKTDDSVIYLQNQLSMKDLEINTLKREVERLGNDDRGKNKNDKSLNSLEKDLNRSYDKHEKIDFEITLKGDSKKIDVRIDVDLSKDRSRWNDFSDKKREKFIQNICDDILHEFSNADIEGNIRDTDDRRDVLTFYTKSNGDVVLDDKYDKKDKNKNKNTSLKSLEKDLDKEYRNYFKDVPIEVELKGSTNDVKYTINVDYKEYKKEWKNLSDSEIKRLMSNIYDDIEDEWRKADIKGYAYDEYDKSDLAEYYKTSGGKDKFNRY